MILCFLKVDLSKVLKTLLTIAFVLTEMPTNGVYFSVFSLTLPPEEANPMSQGALQTIFCKVQHYRNDSIVVLPRFCQTFIGYRNEDLSYFSEHIAFLAVNVCGPIFVSSNLCNTMSSELFNNCSENFNVKSLEFFSFFCFYNHDI